MRKIAITNRKGGVGKTTTAVNLAHYLAMQGNRVLLVDTDTQGQCAVMFQVEPAKGLADLFTGSDPSECLEEIRENLFLLSGSTRLAEVKNLITAKELGREVVFKKIMSVFEDRFHYVIIDTAPSWDILSLNIMMYAQEVLIPIKTEFLSLDALKLFRSEITKIQEYNPGIKIVGVLPTQWDKRTAQSRQYLEQLQKAFGSLILEPVRINVSLSEAPAYGKTIFEYAADSHGAEDYKTVFEEVVNHE